MALNLEGIACVLLLAAVVVGAVVILLGPRIQAALDAANRLPEVQAAAAGTEHSVAFWRYAAIAVSLDAVYRAIESGTCMPQFYTCRDPLAGYLVCPDPSSWTLVRLAWSGGAWQAREAAAMDVASAREYLERMGCPRSWRRLAIEWGR